MKTFTQPKALVENPLYMKQKKQSLEVLIEESIDPPIIDPIRALNSRRHCFTLQSCYGHFSHNDQQAHNNLDPLPTGGKIPKVMYRLAYVALSIENSDEGRRFSGQLKKITAIDPENIQYGSAEWFWNRQVNSYVLQVEPERFKYKDKVMLDFEEALVIEKARNTFFGELETLLLEK